MVPNFSQVFSFSNDPVTYSAPSWAELMDASFTLAQTLHAEDKKVDVIVTLAKGGWPLARMLADFLLVDTCLSLGVKFYSGIETRTKEPVIYQDIMPLAGVEGKRVLLFDDVADTGESLVFAAQHLASLGATEVTTATIFYKSHSIIKPDHFVTENNTWIIFPFEAGETIKALSGKWSSEAVSREEQAGRFGLLGFQPEWVQALSERNDQ